MYFKTINPVMNFVFKHFKISYLKDYLFVYSMPLHFVKLVSNPNMHHGFIVQRDLVKNYKLLEINKSCQSTIGYRRECKFFLVFRCTLYNQLF